MRITKHSGNKYVRSIVSCIDVASRIRVDVYNVLEAFEVHCPAVQHATKKLLCAGLRGKASRLKDLQEARDALSRAIELEAGRKPAKRKAA